MLLEREPKETVLPEAEALSTLPVPRLCNEIQLFDLCEKDVCSFKSDRFCTDPELLVRFEKIEEQESRCPEPDAPDSWDEEEEDLFESEFEHENDEFYDDNFDEEDD